MLEKEKRKDHVGSENAFYIIEGKGDIGPKSRESPSPEGKGEDGVSLVGSGSTRPQGTRIIMGVFVSNGASERGKKIKEKLHRQRKLSLHQLRKWRHIGSEEP
eukprot:1149469-Pelagomonas_calceolata.AAC.2